MDETNTNETSSTQGSTQEKPGSMKWVFIVVVVVLVIFGGYYFMVKSSTKSNQAMPEGSMGEEMVEDSNGTQENTMMNDDGETGDTMMEDDSTMMNDSENSMMDDSQSISVEGGMYYFKPNKITAKKGTPVKITFTAANGMHDFVIDELDVKSSVITAGKTTTVEFTPTEAGEYEFYCSVADHRARGMVGTLVVE